MNEIYGNVRSAIDHIKNIGCNEGLGMLSHYIETAKLDATQWHDVRCYIISSLKGWFETVEHNGSVGLLSEIVGEQHLESYLMLAIEKSHLAMDDSSTLIWEQDKVYGRNFTESSDYIFSSIFKQARDQAYGFLTDETKNTSHITKVSSSNHFLHQEIYLSKPIINTRFILEKNIVNVFFNYSLKVPNVNDYCTDKFDNKKFDEDCQSLALEVRYKFREMVDIIEGWFTINKQIPVKSNSPYYFRVPFSINTKNEVYNVLEYYNKRIEPIDTVLENDKDYMRLINNIMNRYYVEALFSGANMVGVGTEAAPFRTINLNSIINYLFQRGIEETKRLDEDIDDVTAKTLYDKEYKLGEVRISYDFAQRVGMRRHIEEMKLC